MADAYYNDACNKHSGNVARELSGMAVVKMAVCIIPSQLSHFSSPAEANDSNTSKQAGTELFLVYLRPTGYRLTCCSEGSFSFLYRHLRYDDQLMKNKKAREIMLCAMQGK